MFLRLMMDIGWTVDLDTGFRFYILEVHVAFHCHEIVGYVVLYISVITMK